MQSSALFNLKAFIGNGLICAWEFKGDKNLRDIFNKVLCIQHWNVKNVGVCFRQDMNKSHFIVRRKWEPWDLYSSSGSAPN